MSLATRRAPPVCGICASRAGGRCPGVHEAGRRWSAGGRWQPSSMKPDRHALTAPSPRTLGNQFPWAQAFRDRPERSGPAFVVKHAERSRAFRLCASPTLGRNENSWSIPRGGGLAPRHGITAFRKSLNELRTHIANDTHAIPDDADRHRYGVRVSNASAEPTVDTAMPISAAKEQVADQASCLASGKTTEKGPGFRQTPEARGPRCPNAWKACPNAIGPRPAPKPQPRPGMSARRPTPEWMNRRPREIGKRVPTGKHAPFLSATERAGAEQANEGAGDPLQGLAAPAAALWSGAEPLGLVRNSHKGSLSRSHHAAREPAERTPA